MRPLTVSLVLALSACHLGYRVEVVDRPEVDPAGSDPHLAMICVLRPQSFGALASFQHYDNGRLVGVTQGARVYFCYRVWPGGHQLTARSDNDADLAVNVMAGERCYVELRVNFGPDDLQPMAASEAQARLGQLRYVVATPQLAGVPPVCRDPVPELGSHGAVSGCPVVQTSL